MTYAIACVFDAWEQAYMQVPAEAFVATGTLCALVARRYVRWPDEEEWQ
jgi:hypothetical protein